MKGSELKKIREGKGLKAAYVADRAKYAQPHYSKIEAKGSVSVEEFVRIMQAMELRPGDYLENSIEEVKPLLPLVVELKRFHPSAHERVREMLRVAAALLEEQFARIRDVEHSTESKLAAYPSGLKSNQTDGEEGPVYGVGASSAKETHARIPRTTPRETAIHQPAKKKARR